MTEPDEADFLTAAVHEIAHALMYARAEKAFDFVEIYSEQGFVGGRVKTLAGRWSPILKAKVCVAGPIAEQKHTGRSWADVVDNGSGRDIAVATSVLIRLGAAAPSLESVIACTRVVVDFEWPTITRIAHELVRYRRLDYTEFMVCLCSGHAIAGYNLVSRELADIPFHRSTLQKDPRR